MRPTASYSPSSRLSLLQDIDRSGWWALPIALPLVFAASLADVPELKAALDAVPQVYGYLALGLVIVCVVAGLYVGFKRGTEGSNRFGPTPFAVPA